ncbi:MAG: hypothetical protein HGA97_05680 [Chlorobiaceae bacterium]|nr:hypothetical protein [Chlorobiaceae bacterium]
MRHLQGNSKRNAPQITACTEEGPIAGRTEHDKEEQPTARYGTAEKGAGQIFKVAACFEGPPQKKHPEKKDHDFRIDGVQSLSGRNPAAEEHSKGSGKHDRPVSAS